MKYLIAAAVLAAGLFVTTGTASAQHYGSQYGSTHGHGYTHGGHVAPRVGVYPVPSYGGAYQPGYAVGVYSRPVYSGPVHGDGYTGHGYDRHTIHHNRHGHH